MDIYPTTSEFASWPVVADVDLGSATFEVYLEGQWRAGSWASAAVQEPTGTWRRTGRIKVAGAQGSGLVITTSVTPVYRVIAGGETIVRKSPHSLQIKGT